MSAQPAEPVAWLYRNKATGVDTPIVNRMDLFGDNAARYEEYALYAHPDPRIALLERLLADAHVTMNHASIFISTREKMHQTGQELYGKLNADIAAALGEKK